MQFRTAAIQPNVVDDLSRNIKEVLHLIDVASQKNVDIIVLPELWIHSSPLLNFKKLVRYSQLILQELSNVAKSREVIIVGGGIYVEHENLPKIGCPVINEFGEILGFQFKTHLFNNESNLVTPGDKIEVFRFRGIYIGIAICHDIVYPEYARILSLKNADIIFNPSRIMTEGIKPWHLYLFVRSLENRIPIIAPNVWIKKRFNGGSIVIQPVIKKATIYVPKYKVSYNGSTVLCDTINLEKIREARYERLLKRRPELYDELVATRMQIQGKSCNHSIGD